MKNETTIKEPTKKVHASTKMKLVFSNHLAEIMNKKGVTGYQMSHDLGISNQSIYSKYTKTDYALNIKTALLFADYLGVTLDDLYKLESIEYINKK